VVASDIDGYATVAREDIEAELVPPNDADALATSLRRVLDDPSRRNALVTAGRSRADEFSMTHVAEQFIKIYERALASPRDERGRPVVVA
jgi:phosphatidylinositol alpha-mannosyltransferase